MHFHEYKTPVEKKLEHLIVTVQPFTAFERKSNFIPCIAKVFEFLP
ncbi:hypothetical protein EPHNCH_0195 [Anaplasma phagocytophilum str. NCH-1]|uniref:Uncharacterized protein n=2 Tax=Anaplasma phagocytophilum TaxID=948 RepID=Q2GI99_ANAPZ|nr:hypothetical protein APH_1411 [Anaplasma phagocytophilum str. HZ]KJV68317.1 hypothetical protein EPHNCH_0195 [Anaplasma phagocytophilum str. NCH-1]KJV86490.1 hypothetical protein APHNYW_1531 [Anaplasma phagocytophilum str. ApNYW]